MNHYNIDISNPKCWTQVVSDHKQHILEVLDTMRPLYSNHLFKFKWALYLYSWTGGIILYENEIREVAKLLDISFEECLLFQITYELCSACTSAILKSNGQYVHVRTMDWDLELLKKITISCTFYDKDKYLFDAVGWAGCVGIFTGLKKNYYTISLNYRRTATPSMWTNIKALFGGCYPSSFYIRSLLESNDDPIERTKKVKLVAPAYYTILTKEQGVTIIRDRDAYKIKSAPYVQTNCDDVNCGDDIMYSYDRIKQMNKILGLDMSLTNLIAYVSQFPVSNESTIYTTIMTPNGFLYNTIN